MAVYIHGRVQSIAVYIHGRVCGLAMALGNPELCCFIFGNGGLLLEPEVHS